MSSDPQQWKFRKGQKIYLVQEERGEYLVREFVLQKSFNFFGPDCRYLTCDPPIGGTYMTNKPISPHTILKSTRKMGRHPPATPALMQLVGETPEEAINQFINMQMELILHEANERLQKLQKLVDLKHRVFDGIRVSDASLVADA